MSKSQILEWFATNSTNLTATRIAVIMLSALCVSMVIYACYRITYRGVAYNARFNLSNTAILLICVVIMLMISSNIVISLGMVGALSIVRFRTAIKDPKDTVYVFWSIAEGLCVGSQNFKLAIVTTLIIAAVMIAFSLIPALQRKYLIILRGGETPIDLDGVRALTAPYAKRVDVRTSNRMKDHQEIILELRTRKELDAAFSERAMKVEGVTSVNWLIQSGDTVG